MLLLALILACNIVAPIALTTVAAQDLAISDVSEVEDKSKESIKVIYNIAKYAVTTALIIGLIFVVYSLATNNPHAKEYLIAWIIAVIVIVVAWVIVT